MSQPETLRNITALFNQADAFRRSGQFAEAVASCRNAIALAPADLQVLTTAGGLLNEMGRLDEAVECFERAVTIAPDVAELHYNFGFIRQNMGRQNEALASYERALTLKPDYPEALTNHGIVLLILGRTEEALADQNRALELQPAYARALNNRGMVHQALHSFDAALADFDAALALLANYPEAQYGRGNALAELGRYDEAIESYAKAASLFPRYIQAHQNEGAVRLLTGDYARGWPKYEWREGGTFSPRQPNYPQPAWRKATAASGKTVLLYGSHNLGSSVLFARYAELVAATGAIPVLVVPAGLVELFAGLKGAPQIVADGPVMPPFDFHRSLLSMAFVFSTTADTIPAPAAYLNAAPELVETWKERLGDDDGALRVGVCWKTDPYLEQDQSIPMEKLAPLAAVPGIRLIALQDLAGENAAGLKIAMPCDDFAASADDLAQVAAIIANLDLVITVDGTIANIAAALGKPTWIALKTLPKYQWLLNRDDSPWYPSARLFRQQTRSDWTPVIAEMAKALAAKK